MEKKRDGREGKKLDQWSRNQKVNKPPYGRGICIATLQCAPEAKPRVFERRQTGAEGNEN